MSVHVKSNFCPPGKSNVATSPLTAFVTVTLTESSPSASTLIWPFAPDAATVAEAGAKSFTVMAGQSVMLMDSENNVFYIKSTDASGMPLPLRIFDYTERNNDTSNSSTNITSNVNNEINMDNYVTRQEFDDLVSKINSNNNTNNRYRKKGRNNDESSV